MKTPGFPEQGNLEETLVDDATAARTINELEAAVFTDEKLEHVEIFLKPDNN